jgi:hypothetical protein
MTSTITKPHLRQWLAESRTNRVLVVLEHWSKQADDISLHDAILLQAAQWNDWQKNKAAATLSQDELQAQRNRIHANLLHWIQELPDLPPLSISDEILKKADSKDRVLNAKGKPQWLWIAATALLILMGGVTVFNTLWNSQLTLTILVKDKNGQPILQNQGKVILESKFGLDSAKIGDNGEALFKLSASYGNQAVKCRISHPQPYQVLSLDSTYTLRRNQPISLIVGLKNTDRLSGTVSDFQTQAYLEGVRVSIRNIETFTDKNGWFELIIPESMQQKWQRISFEKKAYKRLSLDSMPIHTQRDFHVDLEKE